MDQKIALKKLKEIDAKYRVVAAITENQIPYTTDVFGRFDNHSRLGGDVDDVEHLSWWTNGFYPGILWEMYAFSKQSIYKEYASQIEDELAINLETIAGLNHDVGFMYLLSSGYHFGMTESAKARQRTIHAATILAGRFNVNGMYIRAWDDDRSGEDRSGWSIIDSMMNIELLYWASRETKDPRFAAIADAHAHTVIKNVIREDGSVKHIVVFDSNSGKYLHSLGGQGYAHGSSWTRGQAWGVYGFARAFHNTQKEEYLSSAVKIANYCLSKLQPGKALPIDFDQPDGSDYIDNSATVILASGLLSLATELESSDESSSQKFRQVAINLLEVIDTKYADYTDNSDSIVAGVGVSYHDEPEPQPIVYADFYYIEALMKLVGYKLPLGE